MAANNNLSDEQIMQQYRKRLELETQRIIAQQNYEFYLSHLGNDTPEALALLEKIKSGYNPTERDVFVIINDDPEQTKAYCEMYDLRERTSKGVISKADFEFLLSTIGFDENISNTLREAFQSSGKIVDEYPKEEKEKGLN